MEFLNRISTAHNVEDIIKELTLDIQGPYDLGILFFSQYPYPRLQEILKGITQKIPILNVLGCTCAGIIGSHEEVEERRGVSLLLARLPDVKITPFSLNQSRLLELEKEQDWYDFFNIFPNENPVFLTLPDPFQFDTNRFLKKLKNAYPQSPVIGGLASAAMQASGNTLILNDQLFHEGLIGLSLTGNVRVDTVVSQGCRPLGQTYIVTKAQDNIIYELGGRPFLETLRQVFTKASDRDKLLAQEAIFVGIAMDEYKHEYKRGDFLIRMVLKIDPQTGAGLIGDHIKTGQTVQFHVRDAQSATEDLNALLTLQVNTNASRPKGALVFSCNGRGKHLFKEQNHDIRIIQTHLGPIPAAGFFCAGEIGPVVGQNFLHGFTDSLALFYPRKD